MQYAQIQVALFAVKCFRKTMNRDNGRALATFDKSINNVTYCRFKGVINLLVARKALCIREVFVAWNVY